MITIAIPTTPERHGRLMELLQSINDNTKDIQYRVLYYPNNDGGWVPAVYNMLEGVTGYVVLLGSDCVVKEGWLKTLWDAFIKAFPEGDGVAEPFNELHGETLCQHPLAKTTTIGKYLNSELVHWYSDNLFTDLARRDNKLIYVPEAKIEHKHFVNGKAPMDETYKTVFDPVQASKDAATYSRLKQKYGI